MTGLNTAKENKNEAICVRILHKLCIIIYLVWAEKYQADTQQSVCWDETGSKTRANAVISLLSAGGRGERLAIWQSGSR